MLISYFYPAFQGSSRSCTWTTIATCTRPTSSRTWPRCCPRTRSPSPDCTGNGSLDGFNRHEIGHLKLLIVFLIRQLRLVLWSYSFSVKLGFNVELKNCLISAPTSSRLRLCWLWPSRSRRTATNEFKAFRTATQTRSYPAAATTSTPTRTSPSRGRWSIPSRRTVSV